MKRKELLKLVETEVLRYCKGWADNYGFTYDRVIVPKCFNRENCTCIALYVNTFEVVAMTVYVRYKSASAEYIADNPECLENDGVDISFGYPF